MKSTFGLVLLGGPFLVTARQRLEVHMAVKPQANIGGAPFQDDIGRRLDF